MSRIFDASAIFRAITAGLTSELAEQYTLDLARYELGNALMKQTRIFKTLTPQQAISLSNSIRTVLGNMILLSSEGVEREVLELTLAAESSFYDASYLYQARERGLTLVTADKGMYSKAIKLNYHAILK